MAQFNRGATFSPRILPQFTGGGDSGTVSGYSDGPGGGEQFNMQAPTPVINQGGPGNPGGANNMPRQPFVNNKGPAPNPKPYDGSGVYPQAPGGDTWVKPQFQDPRNSGRRDWRQPPMDPFNMYGNAGQSPQLGRYVPPTMTDPNAPGGGGWTGGGGYSYNIPNSYGSPQWNNFNSTDRAMPQFGQSPNVPNSGWLRTGMGPMYGPTPQIQPSPYARPDPRRAQNYQAFMASLMGPTPQIDPSMNDRSLQPVPNPTVPASPY